MAAFHANSRRRRFLVSEKRLPVSPFNSVRFELGAANLLLAPYTHLTSARKTEATLLSDTRAESSHRLRETLIWRQIGRTFG